MSNRSKWLDWKPGTPETSILEETGKYEPTKTTKTPPKFLETAGTESTKTTETIFGVFVGSPLGNSQKIEAEGQPPEGTDESYALHECKSRPPGNPDVVTEPIQDQIDAAGRILAAAGVQQAEPATLKGTAVELWRDGRRFFLVADEADAQEAIRRFGAHRGEVWTGAELELVASIPDQGLRDELEAFKRQMDGCLTADSAGKGISAAEWQAQMLNQMFQEQGKAGQPGRITAATVRHGERGRK